MTAAGAWFVTPHAVERYREHVPSAALLSYDEALAQLVEVSRVTRANGAVLYRGPKPLRLRCVVGPEVESC